MENEYVHLDKVKKISGVINNAQKNNKHVYVFHGSSNTTREINFTKKEIVNISNLDQILEINREAGYAIVEPNVTMGKLLAETLKKGMMPAVVMEFPNITVGGGIQGAAGESSSYKENLFHHCCDKYELVLGNGEIIEVSRTSKPELFWGIAGSYGSLAILTKVRIRLIKASGFVKIRYIPVKSSAEAIAVFKNEQSNRDVNFLDAILFNHDVGVVMAGEMVNERFGKKPLSFSKQEDNWFYLHVNGKVKNADFSFDILPISEYIFRYDRGAFWMSKFFFEYLKILFLRFTRKLFDRWLDAKSLYRALHAANLSQQFLLQDFCLPWNTVPEFMEYVDANMQCYPVWLCPIAPTREKDFLVPNYLESELIINVGIYTRVRAAYEKYVALNQQLETIVGALGGRKTLYAHQYYTPQKFWEIFNKDQYDELRAMCFAADVFPDMYKKTFVNKKYETRFLAGGFELIKFPNNFIAKD